jgi:hypothetical protein
MDRGLALDGDDLVANAAGAEIASVGDIGIDAVYRAPIMPKSASVMISSALLRRLRIERREHGLDFVALAFRTLRMGLLMVRDMLGEVENFTALPATIFIDRHGDSSHKERQKRGAGIDPAICSARCRSMKS